MSPEDLQNKVTYKQVCRNLTCILKVINDIELMIDVQNHTTDLVFELPKNIHIRKRRNKILIIFELILM